MATKKTKTADTAKPRRRAAKASAVPASPDAVPEEPVQVDAAVQEPAAEPSPVSSLDQLKRIVVFTMEGQRYALPIDAVQEIQQIVAVSEIPDASAAVIGVINLRGEVVPAVDLRRLVGVAEKPYDLQTPMIFCRTGRGLVALIVDEVEDVVDVPFGAMQEPSKVYALSDRLLGVCRLEDGLVFVFDIDKLIPSGSV